LVGNAAVKQSRDVWVLKLGEDLSLTTKPVRRLIRPEAWPHQFDGYLLFVLIVIATLGFVNMLIKVLRDTRPEYVVVVWDSSGPTRRRGPGCYAGGL